MVANCEVECEFISLCGNKSPRCVDWSLWDIIAVGSNNSVAICDSISKENGVKKVLMTLNKHTDRVNCVQWLHQDDGLCYLFSGSSDKSIVCWNCKKTNNNYEFNVTCCLMKHTAPITDISSCAYSDSNNIQKNVVVSCGADQQLHIWKQSNHENLAFEIHHSITFTKNVCLTLNLSIIPGADDILLVYGCNDALVHVNHFDKDMQNVPNELLKLPGHEDWVRDVKLVTLDNKDVLLASCSQDSYIRIWRIAQSLKNGNEEKDKLDDILRVTDLHFSISTSSGEFSYSVELYTVLSGHDGWIYSLDWFKSNDKLQLLSCSMDKSIIIWEKDSESELWLEKLRCGDVGGNTLGFYGAVFNPSGTEVLAHSFNGALHMWKQNFSAENEMWIACPTISGHFGAANDICWEPGKGRFLLSTSSDQTTRLYCKWKHDDDEGSWHEIGRPQVHGYDLQCLAMINSFLFVSGADEKVLRVFNASRNFLSNLKTICRIDVDETTANIAEGATVPALGLSNKAVTTTDLQNTETAVDPSNRGQMYIENQFQNVSLNQPPTEEHLLQNTLWPEIHKLYAHVYEIFCVASSSDGRLVASSAKSSKPEHSNILIWDTSSWQNIATLNCHTLTVTQMEFSNNCKYLLSVSRDRTWAVHEISPTIDGKYNFNIISKSNKKTCHTRIIWACSWSHDDQLFGTASRDKKVMFWKVDSAKEQGEGAEIVTRIRVVPFQESITAIAFGRSLTLNDRYMYLIGKESGGIELHTLQTNNGKDELLMCLNMNQQHCTTVKRLKWRPTDENEKKHTFASCSTDCQVKIFSVKITDH